MVSPAAVVGARARFAVAECHVDIVYLTCSKRLTVASLVHHTEQTEKLKKTNYKQVRQ